MAQKHDLIVRLNEEESKKIKENAKKFGFHTVSEFIRYVGTNIKEVSLKFEPK